MHWPCSHVYSDEQSESVYRAKLFWATFLFLFAMSTEVLLMTVVYDCEHLGVVDALYFGVSTLTTVGLGDIVPLGEEHGCGGAVDALCPRGSG